MLSAQWARLPLKALWEHVRPCPKGEFGPNGWPSPGLRASSQWMKCPFTETLPKVKRLISKSVCSDRNGSKRDLSYASPLPWLTVQPRKVQCGINEEGVHSSTRLRSYTSEKVEQSWMPYSERSFTTAQKMSNISNWNLLFSGLGPNKGISVPRSLSQNGPLCMMCISLEGLFCENQRTRE